MDDPFAHLQPDSEDPFAHLQPENPIPSREEIANARMGFFDDVLRHAGAIGANVGRSTINNLADIATAIPRAGISLAKPLMSEDANAYLNSLFSPELIDEKKDYYKSLGVTKRIPDELVETALEYTPFGLGATKLVEQVPKISKTGANFLSSILGNTAFGAMENKDDMLKGASEGAVIGAVAPALAKGVDKLAVQPLANMISRFSVKPLSNQAVKFMGEEVESPNFYAEQFNKLYKEKSDINKKLWEAVDKNAKIFDESTQNGFVSKPYKKYISDYIEKAESLTPAKKAQFSDSLQLAEEMKNIAPQNIEDVVSLRKNINEILDGLSAKKNLQSNRETNEFAKGLKNSLFEVVEENMKKNPESKFKEVWDLANKSHADLQDFYKVPHKLGGEKTSKDLKNMLKAGEKDADAAIFDLFTPSATQTGTNGYEQLAGLVGKNNAKDYLKSYMMRNIQKGNSVQGLDIYRKLSKEQRSAIFGGSPEYKVFESASNVLDNIEKNPNSFFNQMPWLGHLTSSGALGATVGLGSLMTGDNWDKALMKGAMASLVPFAVAKGAGSLAGKYPEIADKSIKFATEGRGNGGALSALLAQNFLNNKGDD